MREGTLKFRESVKRPVYPKDYGEVYESKDAFKDVFPQNCSIKIASFVLKFILPLQTLLLICDLVEWDS